VIKIIIIIIIIIILKFFMIKRKMIFFVLTKEDEFNSHFIREQLLFEENKATVQKVG
jgi:hypothetical protein